MMPDLQQLLSQKQGDLKKVSPRQVRGATKETPAAGMASMFQQGLKNVAMATNLDADHTQDNTSGWTEEFSRH